MRDMMYDLADLCGFNFQAKTFTELFLFMFLALCGTAIIASVIKLLVWLALNTKRIAR